VKLGHRGRRSQSSERVGDRPVPVFGRVLVPEGGIASGIDLRTVAGRLGHRNPATTLNVYAHFVPEADQQAAEALGHLFGEAMEAAKSESDS